VTGQGWVEAGDLGIGTSIVTRAGPSLTVKNVSWQRDNTEGKTGDTGAKPFTVYNLTVADDHTYFAGDLDGGLWAHNAGCGWTSPGGLEYETGSPQGNRVMHIFEHLAEDPDKDTHSVFNVDTSQEALDMVDEAWGMHGEPEADDPAAYVVNMGRDVGTRGETNLRIIVRPGTNRIITAYPYF
jgi:hypothetical protein